jgi:hypothetical protein
MTPAPLCVSRNKKMPCDFSQGHKMFAGSPAIVSLVGLVRQVSFLNMVKNL